MYLNLISRNNSGKCDKRRRQNLSISIFIELRIKLNINGGDVQRKNVVNNVDKSSLWAKPILHVYHASINNSS